ncbi:MAG TPA: M56 family metallopeptidase [Tahibacter sp.]|nr:M56 family metallopeptidase [Tahibacter sp.]
MEHILSTWLLTYAVHGAMFTALAFVAERTHWGAVASRRDAFWKLALVGGVVTSTVFMAAGSAPAGAAVHLSPQGVIAPALTSDGVFWLVTGWMAITAILALRTARAWRLGVRHAGRRRVIRRGPAPVLLQEILGPAADRVTLSCSRTLRVPVAFAREICVPVRALRELPDDELRALLAHEAAHVVRRDAVWLMIAAAVRALGWWQPLNLVAAARLRLAMELCCDERAAAEPHERAALARCLITVAEWNVRDDGAVLATMASRGSALRRRLESLLDDAPRRRRVVGPWLAVTTVAVPVVCLAPVVTIASLSRVPAAAVRLARQAQAPEAPAASGVPSPGGADARPAARTSKTPAAAQSRPAAVDRLAVSEIAADRPPAATPESMLAGPDLERDAVPAPPSTPLRDAIAAARITPEPAPRTPLDVPHRERRALNRIAQYIGFDTTRPKLDVLDPARVALIRAQQIAFGTTRQK